MTVNGRREAQPSFFDTSRRKIGRQSIENRLGEVFKPVNFDWYGRPITKPTMRRKLKETYFPYFKNNDTRVD